MRLRRTPHGFTLIEVLVAMAILAVALAAASRGASLALNHDESIKKRILADMVAQNTISRHIANDEWWIGTREGSEEQAGIRFTFQEIATATPNPAFRKVVVTVLDPSDPQHTLRQLTGFLINPQYQYDQAN